MADRVGQQVGNYRLAALLGQGGYAEVYLGQHVRLELQAAIKVLHTHLTDQEAEHFQQEAQTIAKLTHSSILRILDYDVQEGVPFLVMDYAPGGSLRRRHPKGSVLPLPQIVSYVKQVAAALQYAHEQKFIHRDVKPENLLLGRQQEVLLSDFGLAALAHSSASLRTQAAVGTLPYMAPEQIEGHPRAASDQYALGVVVYEWLCGVHPFEGSLTEVMVQHLTMPPPPLHERVATIPLSIEQVVLRALVKDPKARFTSVQDFAQALQEAAVQDSSSGRTLPLLDSADPAEAGRRAASKPHLPRGTVTLLFTDIEGSTSLLQQVGERYTQVLSECRHLLRAAFHQYHGRDVDTQGDAFFVAFARATDAVSAAVVGQRTLARHGWPEGVTVRVRMGLHTGEPELTPEGYVGLDVHHAARIMSAAHGGQILLSATTRALVEHELPAEVSLRDLGKHRLKDLQRPIHLFQVVLADLPANFPPLKTLDNSPNNLPVQPTPLVGRVREVGAVRELMQREEVCLVTLTGPGGIGKTRLGLQVAAELSESFADGVFFVDLAPLRNPSLVLSPIAQTLGIQEAAGQSLLERLKEGLRQKLLLLLLDNFEQVLSAARQVADLLAACPRLKVLVTSRERLHVRAEHEFAVPPLALPDPRHLPELAAFSQCEAVALFLERAKSTKSDFQLTPANARAIAEICTRLDGLPLAIELAAARIKLLPPQAMLERLDYRLQVLTSGARDMPARHQTLRHTITWSYDLLNAQEQRLFRRISVFVGGCTLEAIEAVSMAVGDTDANVLEGLASLLEKSLLQRTERDGEELRFAMLETLREYGLEALASAGEAQATHEAHATYYLALAEEAEPQLVGPQQTVWLNRLEQEHDNLRAALRWALERGKARHSMELALRLGGALLRFWLMSGHWSEGRTFLEYALAGREGTVASVRGKALYTAAVLAFVQGDHDQAKLLGEESLALFREIKDIGSVMQCLNLFANVATQRGNLPAARSLLEEAVALSRELSDKQYLVYSPLYSAEVLFPQGEYAKARALLAEVLFLQGEYARARALLEEHLARQREQGNKREVADDLLFLAEILFVSQGDAATLRSLLEEGFALAGEVGDKAKIVLSYWLSGLVALSQGDALTAHALAEASLMLCREIGDRHGMIHSLSLLAQVTATQGDSVAARAFYEESLAKAKEGDYMHHIVSGLEGLASVVAAQGELTWAARLCGAATSLRETIGTPLPPVERASYEQAVAATRAHLGQQAFSKAWAEGRTMTPEQALALQGQPLVSEQPHTPEKTKPHKRPMPTSPHGLTAREVEVLSLVAQGLTDAQVADQLVISPRTVNTHLKSIYGKIQVTSRVAATRYAIEHQLV